MRWHQRHKWIVMPLGQAEDDHGDHRNKDEYLEDGGGFADHLDAENVHPGDDGDKREGDDPVLQPAMPGK